MKLECLIAVQQKKPSAGMPCFLQLGEPSVKVLRLSMMFETKEQQVLTCQLLATKAFTKKVLRGRGGGRTPQGFIKHMAKFHSNSKFPQFFLCQFFLCQCSTSPHSSTLVCSSKH